MIAVDTNLLVRYAVRDDLEQATRAAAFLKEQDCLVLRSVVLETGWVLSSGYRLAREQVVERLRHILRLPKVFTEDVDAVLRALDWYEQGMDLADALHVSVAKDGADGFATFDNGIAKAAKRNHIQLPILSP
jgi:predicted nucleic-acid-binding protein